jgi:hypothetical protein
MAWQCEGRVPQQLASTCVAAARTRVAASAAWSHGRAGAGWRRRSARPSKSAVLRQLHTASGRSCARPAPRNAPVDGAVAAEVVHVRVHLARQAGRPPWQAHAHGVELRPAAARVRTTAASTGVSQRVPGHVCSVLHRQPQPLLCRAPPPAGLCVARQRRPRPTRTARSTTASYSACPCPAAAPWLAQSCCHSGQPPAAAGRQSCCWPQAEARSQQLPRRAAAGSGTTAPRARGCVCPWGPRARQALPKQPLWSQQANVLPAGRSVAPQAQSAHSFRRHVCRVAWCFGEGVWAWAMVLKRPYMCEGNTLCCEKAASRACALARVKGVTVERVLIHQPTGLAFGSGVCVSGAVWVTELPAIKLLARPNSILRATSPSPGADSVVRIRVTRTPRPGPAPRHNRPVGGSCSRLTNAARAITRRRLPTAVDPMRRAV